MENKETDYKKISTAVLKKVANQPGNLSKEAQDKIKEVLEERKNKDERNN